MIIRKTVQRVRRTFEMPKTMLIMLSVDNSESGDDISVCDAPLKCGLVEPVFGDIVSSDDVLNLLFKGLA
jgi:hypothetical protein